MGARHRIGLVGAGTAGSAAALLLARAGHDVTVFERVPEPGAVGAGIMLQPTGMHVLARLGLLEGVLARGARVDRLYATNGRGWPVLDLHYGLLGPGRFGVGLHRGVLLEALFDAVRAGGIRVKTGVAIERIHSDSGRFLVDDAGVHHGPFDLVVVADGARSRLRETSGVRHRVSEYPWGALWFVAEDRERRFDGVLRQFVRGTRTLFGLMPTGTGPGGNVPLVSLFWSARVDALEALRSGDVDAWRRRVLAIAPEAAPVVAQIGSMQELTAATYRDVRMPAWHGDGVVFLGDAAHATSPQLGQGCNLALVDALVLANVLAEEEAIAPAIARYTRLRRSHLRFYQVVSRWLTPLFQGDATWLAPLRDVGVGLACRVPWVRTQMVASMAGVKTGFVAGRLALGELARAALPVAAARE